MNKTKLVKFIKQQMTVSSDFIEFNKKQDDEKFHMFWLGRWGTLSELLQMIEGGDFDDNDSN